jgi:hypothetical protein
MKLDVRGLHINLKKKKKKFFLPIRHPEMKCWKQYLMTKQLRIMVTITAHVRNCFWSHMRIAEAHSLSIILVTYRTMQNTAQIREPILLFRNEFADNIESPDRRMYTNGKKIRIYRKNVIEVTCIYLKSTKDQNQSTYKLPKSTL